MFHSKSKPGKVEIMPFVLLGTFNVKHLCRKSCFTDSRLSPVGKKNGTVDLTGMNYLLRSVFLFKRESNRLHAMA